MLGVLEVGEVVGPVWEVEGEVFVAFLPDVADFGAAFDDEVFHAEDFEAGCHCQTTVKEKKRLGMWS